jgi:hypothetical protein
VSDLLHFVEALTWDRLLDRQTTDLAPTVWSNEMPHLAASHLLAGQEVASSAPRSFNQENAGTC